MDPLVPSGAGSGAPGATGPQGPSGATQTSVEIGAGPNVFNNITIPEYLGSGTPAANNVDGTVTTAAQFFQVSAVGRFAVGNFVSLAVRLTGGGTTPVGTMLFVGPNTTVSIPGSPDQFGYYAIENTQIPAGTTSITVHFTQSSAVKAEVIFCPSAYTHAARLAGNSRLAYSAGPLRPGMPIGSAAIGQSVQKIIRPNGAAPVWFDKATALGDSPAAASFTALRYFEEMLRNFGLIDKLLYLNPRLGSTPAGALTPLLDKVGYGLDVAPASFSSFTEASGLTGVRVDTGINPDYAGMNRFGMSMGMYSLTAAAAASGAIFAIGGPNYGLFPNNANLLILDWFGAANGRVQGALLSSTATPTSTFPTAGLLCGTRDPSGISRVYRNGVPLGTSNVLNTASQLGGVAPSAIGTINVDTTNAASGGDFIGLDLDPDDIMALTQAFQFLNANLATSRAVNPDGLSY